MTGVARLTDVVLDCPDPRVLADFYTELTGWKEVDTSDGWIALDGGAGVKLAFQRAADFRPPTWPDPTRPQQYHLDLEVERGALEAAEARVMALGAGKPSTQPGGNWRVFTDPAGHPFCLCWEE
jgi:catechol 2,3-dioxygenase-like lactoylglutathione lyase family enzyme